MLLRTVSIRPLQRNGFQLGFGHRCPIRTLTHFNVIEHTSPCSHTRQYPGGAEPGQHSDLRLSVKQYVPKHRDSISSTALTVIGTHGNGLPSELLEPFWDDFYEQMESRGQQIRSIWVADQAHQGRSGVINERILGNDPSWFDHARDLLFFINLKQRDMPQPLFGIGHSMGAFQLAHLALLHPSLLQGLVLMDPVIQAGNPGMPSGLASTYRRDLWPSREAARDSFSRSKFYQTWDPRAFERWIEAGLRDLPTETYENAPQLEGDKPVTLTTAKPQEVYSYLRPLYKGDAAVSPLEDFEHYADLHPDDAEPDSPFYRPESAMVFRKLPELRPPVTYITGNSSRLAGQELNRQRLELTGSGVGGSGGAKRGRVSGIELDCGHFIPMEKPTESARLSAEFVDSEVRRWEENRRQFEQQWTRRPRPQRVALDDEWRERIGPRASK